MSEARNQISSYLLGELGDAEAAEFERGMAADPALREEVEGLRPGASAEPRPSRRRPRLPSLTLRPAAATGLAVLLLAVGLGAGLLIDGGGGAESPSGGPDLILSRFDDGPSGAHGEVALASDEQRAQVLIGGLDPSGDGRFYELWLLDDDGKMIALGSFRVGAGGEAEVDLPLPVDPSRYAYFDVSLQEDDGDPAHSGVSVLRGPTSS
jgi:hypothetical protein